MRVLVTGIKGQLGYDVEKCLRKRGNDVLGIDLPETDITDENAVRKIILSYRPDAVLHCAAYTKVDLAEDEEELCMRVNAEGTENIAKACREIDAKMAYISTDYVFQGTGERPWEIDDPTGPLNVYGRSKLAGEQAVQAYLQKYFIVRTSWMIGEHGHNFVKIMQRLAETHDKLQIVDDQIGSPTFTADLAPLLCDMIETDRYGIYHATNEGFCSWAELAEAIFRISGKDVRVEHVSTEAYGSKAVRPKNSRMSKHSLDAGGFSRLPAWEISLHKMLKETAVI
ncbi:MAG: dTDP-4-dehydrorhamnose reductase [Solobacterium sp.]|nr:dTDP-4-dehydrorhamnose reductase [Solobacterium sp.]